MDELSDEDKLVVARARRIQLFLTQPFTVGEGFTGIPGEYVKIEDTVLWGDLDLYLRQPSYGIGYLLGKVQIEGLMSDRLMQIQGKFVLRDFFDQFVASGIIPISLICWSSTRSTASSGSSHLI